MKQICTSLALGAVLLLTSFTAQRGSIEEVISALRSGNASKLASYFDANVGLTLPDKSDSYSKAQAQLIIKDFFDNNNVTGFVLKHKGEGAGGSQYCVGTLQTSAGNYRTNVFMRRKDGEEVIKEIRFQSIE
ncbi:MAG: DUF4783 domain-containing protein [Chitinophagaceae bacterium]|nr:DUF4783 domain-containing protein [Chitinophagaceae bacterium]MCB0739993.1 DUF4783 domain-containing protein [Chitinophagaceae bacterium]HQV05530.1 DUF4783 domain-containing protein [Chitinophagaceae bacterium]